MQTENIAYACLTKHCENGDPDSESIRWILNDLSTVSYSIRDFEVQSNRYASVLRSLGIKPSDVVSVFLPRSPELINSFFAICKNLALSCILFSTLGEDSLLDRLNDSQTKILITKKNLLRKILPVRENLVNLEFILLIDEVDHQNNTILSLPKLASEFGSDFTYPHYVEPELPAFLQYTSGSTGKPKGALHVHDSLSEIVRSFNEILAVSDDELYWCTADPAWITGLVYGIIAPLSTNTRQIQFSGTFNSENWLSILEKQQVHVWYTAPTALRMLMQEEKKVFTQFDTSSLKRMYSVGEPLNPEIYHWGKEIFGVEIFDTWFQSETGCIMIANHPGLAVKPGSMGKPRSGIRAEIMNEKLEAVQTDIQGNLCLKKNWGSMFRAYFHRDQAYQDKFNGDNYITGDLATKDADGYFWYISRSDDVINTAGHLIGPFEVESALLEIEEIIDVAVIGVADQILHQKIVAYITLLQSVVWSRELELKIRVHISNRVSTVAIPSEFHVIDRIPKNQSGKILRRVLKAIYEGNDPGDLSTMEQL